MDILANLNNQELKNIKIITFDKDDVIFFENEECQYIGLIMSGSVTISSFTYNGREVIYNTLTSGHIFGNNLIFSSDPRFRGNVTVKEKSSIALIDKENLISLLQTNRLFLLDYLKYASDFSKHLNSKIKLLSFTNSIDRLFYYFYINNNKIKYPSITSLADSLFIKRETLSRLLSDLEDKNVIELNRSKKVILLK